MFRNSRHAGHDIAFAGDPFREAAGDDIGVGERIDIRGSAGRVVDDQWCGSHGAGFGDFFQVGGAQEWVAWRLGEDAGKFAAADAFEGLVEGFAFGFVEVDRAVAEVFLDLESIDIGKLDLQGFFALGESRQ